jgi:hypothetical protein
MFWRNLMLPFSQQTLLLEDGGSRSFTYAENEVIFYSSALKETVCSSKTLATFHQTTHHIPRQ